MIDKDLLKTILKCGSILKSTERYDVVKYGSLFFRLLKHNDQYVKIIGRSWNFIWYIMQSGLEDKLEWQKQI